MAQRRIKGNRTYYFFSIFQRHIVSSTKGGGGTAAFKNQLSPEGNLLVDDIEVKSAQRLLQIISEQSKYEFDWKQVPIHYNVAARAAEDAVVGLQLSSFHLNTARETENANVFHASLEVVY